MTENIYKAYTFDGVNFILYEKEEYNITNFYHVNTLTKEVIVKTNDPEFTDEFEITDDDKIDEFVELCEDLKNKMNLREEFLL